MGDRTDRDFISEYCSQPAERTSDRIFQKWRKSTKHTETSSPNIINQPQQIETTRKWAIPDDVSGDWSKDVIEFYNKGDSSYCYSALFSPHVKLERRFWSILLKGGYVDSIVFFLDHIHY